MGDLVRYRARYPDVLDNPSVSRNIAFYNDEISSVPDGAHIEDMLRTWDHERLEQHHGYIQWLFPIREHGVNSMAQPLMLHEAVAIGNSPVMMSRMLRALRMMLNFYGMELHVEDIVNDGSRGAMMRFDRTAGYEARYRNLLRRSHNFLRVTRILKCLGEIADLERLKTPWLMFLAQEVLGQSAPLGDCGDALTNYWIETVRDDEERRALHDLCRQLQGLPVGGSNFASVLRGAALRVPASLASATGSSDRDRVSVSPAPQDYVNRKRHRSEEQQVSGVSPTLRRLAIDEREESPSGLQTLPGRGGAPMPHGSSPKHFDL